MFAVLLKALLFPNYPVLTIYERRIEFDCTPRPDAIKCGEYPLREKITALPESAIVVLNAVKEESYWIHCTCSVSIAEYVNERLTYPERFKGPKIIGSLDVDNMAFPKSL